MDTSSSVTAESKTGSTTSGIQTVLHTVTDLAAAKAVYTALLGVEPQTDESYHFAARAGFDPRESSPSYRWFRITPRRIQAWREVEELAGRELMRAGRWLV